MPADYSKENSPVNKVEQKLTRYFESERQRLKAPDDLWSRIETQLEPAMREARANADEPGSQAINENVVSQAGPPVVPVVFQGNADEPGSQAINENVVSQAGPPVVPVVFQGNADEPGSQAMNENVVPQAGPPVVPVVFRGMRARGISWLFRQWRLAGAAAAVLVMLVVSATVLTMMSRQDGAITTPPLTAPEMLTASPAPVFGAAPRGFEGDKGTPVDQAPDDVPQTPFPVTAAPKAAGTTAPIRAAPPPGVAGPAGPPGKEGAEPRAATRAPGVTPKPVPRPQATAPPQAATPGAAAPSTLAGARRQIMSTASVSIEVKDVGGALEELRAMVESLGGFIGQLSRSDRAEQQQATATVRLPQEQFSTTLSRLESLGKIQDRASKIEDVTERFIDLEARLKTLERQEQSILALLEKTQSVSEVLAIERELALTRGEIERVQGQLNSLKRQVEMATITANLFTLR